MIKYKLKSESILYLYFFTTTTADHSTFVIYEVQVPRHQIRGSNKIKKNLASVKSQRSLVPWTRPNPPPRQLGTHLVGPHVIERTANPPIQSNFLPSLSLWSVSPRRSHRCRLVSHLLPPAASFSVGAARTLTVAVGITSPCADPTRFPRRPLRRANPEAVAMASVAELKEKHAAATASVNSLRERLRQRRETLLDTDGDASFSSSCLLLIHLSKGALEGLRRNWRALADCCCFVFVSLWVLQWQGTLRRRGGCQ
jgi:hypothetical protein